MTEMEISGVFHDHRREYPVVVLQEQDGSRIMPIWIGYSEGHSLQICLGEVACPRPLTHELTARVCEAMGVELVRVLIMEFKDRTYHARLVIRGVDDQLVTIDARASDAIALAARSGCPILADESIPQFEVGGLAAMQSEERERAIANVLKRIHPRDLGSFGPR